MANTSLPAGTAPIERFRLFEVTPIGVASIAAGILYFIVLGKRVLPAVSAAPAGSQTSLEYL